jgi:protein-L-isoaspartate(D-aspartate) O-methyltransferase
MLDYEYSRHRMVEAHIARRGVRHERVLAAMRKVPREKFVDEGFEEFAYEDSPLPIGSGQTISQPFIVARMAEAAEIEDADRVLEIGTGSGYAAAILAELASEVVTVERHAELAELAMARLRDCGYGKVDVKVADGTKGWPDKAPFDAIIVTAGGPSVPVSLQEQLEIGGRLVIPVGEHRREQRLLRITRVSANKFEEEDLGGVMFVPLIGEEGWADEKRGPAARDVRKSVPDMIAAAAEDLPPLDDPAFGSMFDRMGGKCVMLLGEASHGTSEFYKARAAITQRLIEEHGFTIVAVEADWPDAAALNRYVRGKQPRESDASAFQRFPTWMWRNTDVAAFVQWLRRYNDASADDRKAGFHGLDLYNMSGSIAAVLDYLDRVDPEAGAVARERYGCLTPWQNEPATYGRAVLSAGYRACEEAVVSQCRDLLQRSLPQGDGDLLDAQQSARLIASAERYYRVMYYGGAETWNLRDRHMFDTLQHLLDAAGPDSKAVVWAHNSHIGDARHTEMGQTRDELNIGQLCREHYGDAAALVGFGTHAGQVACASDWDGAMEIKDIRPSLSESVERLCHDSGKTSFLLDFARSAEVATALQVPKLERYIGVVYRPETERLSHYMESALSRQFDIYVWFDRTSPVTPLAEEPPTREGDVPDTFPFGM